MPRTTVHDLKNKKEEDEAITMLTSYDYPTARIVDKAGTDVILVGDSVGNTQLGYDTTLPVTLEQSLSHTEAVVRGTESAMVVGDMPFMSYGSSVEESVENAGRYLKEAGANAVKLETAIEGGITVDIIDRLTELGIPAMGHLGLTPQRIHEMGGYKVQGRGEMGDTLVETAHELEDAGIFALVLEAVPEPVAKRVTEEVDVPTIGIGAGRHVDGQVLVIDDLLGLSEGDFTPTFVKEYADLESVISEAVEEYLTEVTEGEFPSEEHVFDPQEE